MTYICPRCNADMRCVVLTCLPPIERYECWSCGYKSKGVREEPQREILPEHLRSEEVQDDEIKLEPCPFCGSSAEIEEMAMPEGLRYAARCRDDSGKCEVIPTTRLCLSPKAAALFWNWRGKIE